MMYYLFPEHDASAENKEVKICKMNPDRTLYIPFQRAQAPCCTTETVHRATHSPITAVANVMFWVMMMIYFSFVCVETFLARRWVLGGFRCVGVIIMIAVLGAAAADSNANSVEEQIHAESIFVEELVAHVFMQLYVLSFVIE